MEVNGFKLPDSFASLCQDIREGNAEDSWLAKGQEDSYGNPRVNSDIEFLTDVEKIKERTDKIVHWFKAERYQQDPEYAACPGYVKVTSVHKFVCFGQTAADEPFCFDFRQNPEEPSVITWNDEYWQRIAPNFDAFMGLYAPWSEQEGAWLRGDHER